MIYIYYNRFTRRLSPKSFDHFFQQLPPGHHDKILKFKNWQDGQRSLLGQALLISALNALGLSQYTLNNLKVNQFQRPYFDDTLDFNISHSGEYVICAISKTCKVGIDIEEIKTLPITDFKTQFSEKEWEEILKVDNTLYSFYSCWTKKEAFLKAIGTGLNIPLRKVEIMNNKISWNTKEWYLHEIKLDEHYVCHLSTDIALPQIVVEKIDFY